MTVAVDLDGVLCDAYPALQHVWRDLTGNLGQPMPPAVMLHGHPDCDEVWNRGVVDYDVHRRMGPVPGALEAVRTLAAAHDVIIVTARGDVAERRHAEVAATAWWLAEFDVPYTELHFTADKLAVRWDVLLDDAPYNVQPAVAAGRRAVVFDQPWNQHVDVPERVVSWDAFLQLVSSA